MGWLFEPTTLAAKMAELKTRAVKSDVTSESGLAETEWCWNGGNEFWMLMELSDENKAELRAEFEIVIVLLGTETTGEVGAKIMDVSAGPYFYELSADSLTRWAARGWYPLTKPAEEWLATVLARIKETTPEMAHTLERWVSTNRLFHATKRDASTT